MENAQFRAKPEQNSSTIGKKLIDVYGGTALFAVVGPPLGSLAVSGGVVLMALTHWTTSGLSGLGLALMVVLFFAMNSYPIGVIPAAVVGGIVGWFRTSFVAKPRPLTGGLLGVIVTGAFVAVQSDFLRAVKHFSLGNWIGSGGAITFLQADVIRFFIMPAFVGGALTSLLYRRLFKRPNPTQPEQPSSGPVV